MHTILIILILSTVGRFTKNEKKKIVSLLSLMCVFHLDASELHVSQVKSIIFNVYNAYIACCIRFRLTNIVRVSPL